jgi:hypothetical protein
MVSKAQLSNIESSASLEKTKAWNAIFIFVAFFFRLKYLKREHPWRHKATELQLILFGPKTLTNQILRSLTFQSSITNTYACTYLLRGKQAHMHVCTCYLENKHLCTWWHIFFFYNTAKIIYYFVLIQFAYELLLVAIITESYNRTNVKSSCRLNTNAWSISPIIPTYVPILKSRLQRAP